MRPEVKLFIAVMTGQDKADIDRGLFGFSAERGGDEVAFRNVGDRDNNCGMVEVTNDPMAALYEKLTNGFDGITELWQRLNLFTTDPRTPIEALREIADKRKERKREGEREGPVYLLANNRKQGKAVQSTTFSVLDRGIGIKPEDFPTTIMSLGGSNKINNFLLCGTYGMGGSAVLNFSEYVVIASAHHEDPDRIGFTVGWREEREGYKAPVYVYAVQDDSTVFEVLRSELPDNLLVDPRLLDKDTLDLMNHKIIMPDHGTVVRCVDYAKNNRVDVYNYLRETGFGIPLPVRLLVNDRSEEERKKDDTDNKPVYHPAGLRDLLNRGSKNYRPVWKPEPTRYEYEGGHFTLQPWIIMPTAYLKDEDGETLDELDAESVAETGQHRVPAKGMLSNENNLVFITLNGQTHARLPTQVIFRNAKMDLLKSYVFFEINCDQLTIGQRGKVFASNRQHTKVGFEELVKEHILAYIRGDEKFREWQKFLVDAITSQRKPDISAVRSQLYRWMKTPVAGSIFTKFGVAMPVDKLGVLEKVPAPPRPTTPTVRRKPVLVDNPADFQVAITTAQIEPGEDWLYVKTNAANQFDGDIKLTCADTRVKISTETTKALRDGSKGFLVETPKALSGSQISFSVRIKGSSARADRLVLCEPRAKRDIFKTTENSQLEISFHAIDGAAHQEWGMLESNGRKPDDVSFHHAVADGTLHIFYNSGFAPYQHFVRETIKLRQGRDDGAVAEQIKDDYSMMLAVAALMLMDRGIDQKIEPSDFHEVKSTYMGGLLAMQSIQGQKAA